MLFLKWLSAKLAALSAAFFDMALLTTRLWMPILVLVVLCSVAYHIRDLSSRPIRSGELVNLVTPPGITVTWKKPATAEVYDHHVIIVGDDGARVVLPTQMISVMTLAPSND